MLFGTGDYYRKYKDWFKKDDILGLIDNDESRQGQLLDGYQVYSPREAVRLPFDCIVILSVHEEAMREQLKGLGVPEEKICIFSELYKHPELTAADRVVSFFGDGRTVLRITAAEQADAVLLMSHNLDLNGAALALFYMAQIFVKNGMRVFFASWSEGALGRMLYECNIPVIVDPNLQMRTQRETEWTHSFHRIVCNTLNYYQFLSDRDVNDKVLWWLHDPAMFYRGLDQELLEKIRMDNLSVYAVSPVAKEAFHSCFPGAKAGQLVYGLPDAPAIRREHERIVFVALGNVQEYKGQDILIEALKCLDEKAREQIQVRIVGFKPSAYANAVKEAAESLGDIIEFVPPVGREEVHWLLEESDVLVCPSRQDCMPTVAAEAMMHGVACLVSDVTGTAACISQGENGLVFKSGDAEALAGKIRWCMENREKLPEMGKEARKVYEEIFSMEVFEKNVMQAVREAL